MKILAIGMGLNGLLHGPYYLQLAAGWTKLLIKVNFIILIPFIFILISLTNSYGALGGAIAWTLLNIVFVFSIVPSMHKKLLTSEMKEWFIYDNAIPIISSLSIAILLKSIYPYNFNTLTQILFLLFAFLLILLSGTIASTRIRKIILAHI